MKPALAFPYNDPDGTMLPHLQAILPDLKKHFDRAFIASPLSTLELLQQNNLILTDNFFTVFQTEDGKPVGERFAHLYLHTAETAPPDQPIHLCFLDRLSFAIESQHHDIFLADVDSIPEADLPIVFQRSTYAWETHPQNYRELEGIVTKVGMNLFRRELDYAWCHLVINARQLGQIMPFVKNPDISMVAEILFYLQDVVQTREVDWLAWEDPFILNRDAAELKLEREESLDETNKRLNYVLPMIETLTRLSRNGRK